MAVVAINMLWLLLLSNLQMQSESQPLHIRRELQHLLDLELPRKLRISEELATGSKNVEEASSKDQKEDKFAGKEEQIRQIHENGEWDEDDAWEHFEMDYSSVKRRRPIHNTLSSQHP